MSFCQQKIKLDNVRNPSLEQKNSLSRVSVRSAGDCSENANKSVDLLIQFILKKIYDQHICTLK